MKPTTELLQFNWMFFQKPGVSCKDLHGDTSCLYQIFHNKCYETIKKSAKFYLILHMIPFIIFRLKKINDRKKLKQAIIKFIKTYIGSLLFMSSLVGGNKVVVCLNNYVCGDQPVFDGKVFWWGSFISSLSLFFEDSSRREQISYFVLVRALRSIYFAMKRRNWVLVPYQQKTAFVFIFGMMSYIFYEHKNLLKHTNIYEKLWGQA